MSCSLICRIPILRYCLDLSTQETTPCRMNVICDLGPAPQPQISQVLFDINSMLVSLLHEGNQRCEGHMKTP